MDNKEHNPNKSPTEALQTVGGESEGNSQPNPDSLGVAPSVADFNIQPNNSTGVNLLILSPANFPYFLGNIELTEQRDQTNFFAKAKFPDFQIQTRDVISDGIHKLLLMAFEKQDKIILAHVYNLETKSLELIPATTISEKIPEVLPYAVFFKARDLFQKKLNPIQKLYTKEEPTPVEETDQQDRDEATKSLSEPPNTKKMKKGKKKKEKVSDVRRSKRLAETEVDDRPTKKRKKDPRASSSRIDNKKTPSEAKPKSSDRTLRAGNRSKKKQEEPENNLELAPDTFQIETAELRVPVEPPKPKVATEDRPAKSQTAESRRVASHENASADKTQVASLERTLVDNTPVANSAGPSVPLFIPLSWHEQQMTKIREAYFKNTILTMQMNEMLQLTSSASIFDKLNK